MWALYDFCCTICTILYTIIPYIIVCTKYPPQCIGEFASVRITGCSFIFILTAEHYKPWSADSPLFCKQTGFLVLLSTWTVQNSLDNCMLLMQGCPAPLKNSTTGFYNSTGMHSTSFWLAFLASVQQERALEHAFLAHNSMNMHCHAYQKYIGSLWNTDTFIIIPDLQRLSL